MSSADHPTGQNAPSDPRWEQCAQAAQEQPAMTLIGEIRGYTYPVCPECGAWAMYYNKSLSSDICGACGWIAEPAERAAQEACDRASPALRPVVIDEAGPDRPTRNG
jgi:hypothetical protein